MATLSNNDIAQSIYASSKGKAGHELSAHLKNVVNFLNKRRLLNKSPDILNKLKKIADKENGVVNVKVWSSHKLANTTKHDLAESLNKRYKGKEVVFEEVIDEKLIGGFKVEVGDEVIDFTLKNQVNKLQAYLTRD